MSSSNYWTKDLTLQSLSANAPGVNYDNTTGVFQSTVSVNGSLALQDTIGQAGFTSVVPYPKFIFLSSSINFDSAPVIYEGNVNQLAVFNDVFNSSENDPNPVFTLQKFGDEIIGVYIHEDGKYKMFTSLHAYSSENLTGVTTVSFGFGQNGSTTYDAVGFGFQAPVILETEFEVIASPRLYQWVYSVPNNDSIRVQALNDFKRGLGIYMHGYISKIT